MKPTVVTLGDVIVDLNIVIPRLPVEVDDLQFASELFAVPGGSNGNFIIVAQRLGLQARPIGPVGDDLYGKGMLRDLRREGIDLSLMSIESGSPTTVAVVLIDDAGQHAFLGHVGARGPQELPDEWRRAITEADAVFTAGYAFSEMHADLLLDAVVTTTGAGVPFFFDAGPQGPAMSAELLNQVVGRTSVLFATADEIEPMASADDYATAARLFLSQGPEMVVIKLGAEGCHIFGQGSDLKCPAFSVEARDTTGAGDSFAAAFVYGYLMDYDLRGMGTLANAVGAAAVQKVGAGTSLPTIDEMRAILQDSDVNL